MPRGGTKLMPFIDSHALAELAPAIPSVTSVLLMDAWAIS